MLWTVLGAHVVGMAGTAIIGRRSMRAALATASVAPAFAAVWALTQLGDSAPGNSHSFTWVDALDLRFVFRTDSVAMLMTAIVSGIGTLVFVYATGYFSPQADGSVRFPVTLLAFSTSMLGLVLAESIWTLFIFWELTSVTSFLLVGHKNSDAAVQAAARRALMITGGGGLALLAGLMVLAQAADTSLISEFTPVAGTAGTVAALLVFVGVASKSAQVPFHVWLPGAMAAPTPVSAYLHSATMVKAGILLMALTGPAFVDVAAWKTLGIAAGALSMVWGGVGALRQRDAKLILAWGTISQLGLLVTLLAIGSAKATFAAIAILTAHALFKATLFLVVGEIDIRTGTRSIDELGGLHRSMPIATMAAVLASLSMAGAPPLLGFVAKEAAIEATLGLTGTERVITLAVVIIGSIITVAYTTRFVWTVFGPGPGPETVVAPRRIAMTVPAVALSLAGLLGYIALGWVNSVVGPAATQLDPKASVYDLIAWPGMTTAFSVSIAILAMGAAFGLAVIRWPIGATPQAVGADMADRSLDSILYIARLVTVRVQHGSLPVYLTTMAIVASAATMPFIIDISFDHLYWWDHQLQMLLAIAIAISALAGAFVKSRLGAALTLGAVGISASGLFVVHGAPDLALTQLLIETIIVVGFVVGLGHLTRRFPIAGITWRGFRIAISALGGIAVMAGLIAASAEPTGRAPIRDLASKAVERGGGNNIVNVILTDIRALDTLGEVVVLATVALGILALADSKTATKTAEGTATTKPTVTSEPTS